MLMAGTDRQTGQNKKNYYYFFIILFSVHGPVMLLSEIRSSFLTTTIIFHFKKSAQTLAYMQFL